MRTILPVFELPHGAKRCSNKPGFLWQGQSAQERNPLLFPFPLPWLLPEQQLAELTDAFVYLALPVIGITGTENTVG